MNSSEHTVIRAIVEQAEVWYCANRDQSLSLQQRREFMSWLQASPVHVREYLALARLSADLRCAMRLVEESSEQLVAAALAEPDVNIVAMPPRQSTAEQRLTALNDHYVAADRQSRFSMSRIVTIAAGIAAIAIVGLGWWGSVRYASLHGEYRTAHGEQRTVRLEDGSVLHLNSDSVVRVDFSKRDREIFMDRGQALFKVAKNKARPFRVRAGATEVVAVGTEFDVRRLSEDVVVTVVEGSVAVDEIREATSPVTGMPVSTALVRLAAGQQARVAANTMPTLRKAVDVRAVDVRPSVAWVQQKIIFEHEALRDVVNEFNRYGALPLVIEDRDLANLRISGVFNAYDLDSFVGFLEKVDGIVVHRDIDRVRISITRNTGERT